MNGGDRIISREQMEQERGGNLGRPIAPQIEQIVATLDRITTTNCEVASLEAAWDDVNRNMTYTEWTACALDGNPLSNRSWAATG